MAGERLTCAAVNENGIEGDRTAIVVRGRRIITSRTHPKLLGHHATIVDGNLLVDGLPWDSPEVARRVEAAAGEGAQLVRYDGPERFDVLPLLVATDGAIAALGVDSRRLRPNLIIGGVDGLAERTWEGKLLRIGAVAIRMRDLRQRCVMTTYDPDTLEQNIDVLRTIVREFDGTMALNCAVEAGGVLEEGQTVAVFDQ